jgi:hypothetical protein
MTENLEVLERKARLFARTNSDARAALGGMLEEFSALAAASAAALAERLDRDLPALQEALAARVQATPLEELKQEAVEALVQDAAQDWLHGHVRAASRDLEYDARQLLDRIDRKNSERVDGFGTVFCQQEGPGAGVSLVDGLEVPFAQDSTMGMLARAGGGAALGYISVALLGPLGLIPAIIGGGVMQGWLEQRRKNKLLEELRLVLPRVIAPIKQGYREQALRLMSGYRDQVAAQIDEVTAGLDDQLQQMLETRARSEAEVMERLGKIRAQITELTRLERRAVELEASIR